MKPLIYTASIPDEQPENLLEMLALDEAREGQGYVAMKTEQLEDISRLNRWYGEGAWVKMRYTKHTFQGDVVIHYFRNTDTGRSVGFKFKKRLPKKRLSGSCIQ